MDGTAQQAVASLSTTLIVPGQGSPTQQLLKHCQGLHAVVDLFAPVEREEAKALFLAQQTQTAPVKVKSQDTLGVAAKLAECPKMTGKGVESHIPEADRKPYHKKYMDAESRHKNFKKKFDVYIQEHNRLLLLSSCAPLMSGFADLIKGYALTGGFVLSVPTLLVQTGQEVISEDTEYGWLWCEEDKAELYKQRQLLLHHVYRKPLNIHLLLMRTVYLIIACRMIVPTEDPNRLQEFNKVRNKLGPEGRGVHHCLDLARWMVEKVLAPMTLGGKLINEDTADPVSLAAMQLRTDLSDAAGEDYPYALMVELSRDPGLDVTLKDIQWTLLHCALRAADYSSAHGDRLASIPGFDLARRLHDVDPSSTKGAYEYLFKLIAHKPPLLAEALSQARKARQLCMEEGDDLMGARTCLWLARLLLNGADGATFSREEAESAFRDAKVHRKLSDKIHPELMKEKCYHDMHTAVKEGLQLACKQGASTGKSGWLPAVLLGDIPSYRMENVAFHVNRTFVHCTTCGRKFSELKKCRGCGVAPYCSSDCQAADWPQHKRECKQLRQQKEEEKSSKGKQQKEEETAGKGKQPGGSQPVVQQEANTVPAAGQASSNRASKSARRVTSNPI